MSTTFHCYVNGTDYGPSGNKAIYSLSVQAAGGAKRNGKSTIVMKFKAALGYSFVNRQEVQIWETGTTANALFGGFIANAKRKIVKNSLYKIYTLTCIDYNSLLDTIRTDADDGAAITIASNTFHAQIAAVVLAMQKNGDSAVNKTIDASTYVQHLTSSATLPAFQIKGQSLRDALQVIMNNAQLHTTTLRPKFGLELKDDGAGGVECAVVVWDGAVPPTNLATYAITPSGGQQGILAYEVVDDSSMPLANRRQIIRPVGTSTHVFTYAGSTSAATYNNPYQSHGLTGHKGYWQDAPIKADSSVTSDADAQNKINLVGAATEYPRETATVQWDRPAGSAILVRPGDGVTLITDDLNVLYQVTSIQVDFPFLNNILKERITFTLGPPLLKLFEDGTDGVAGPAHEHDFVPPEKPGLITIVSQNFNPVTGNTDVALSYTASTSPDTAGYDIVYTHNGHPNLFQVGTDITPTISLPPGQVGTLDNYAFDGATPPNVSQSGGTVSITVSMGTQTMINRGFDLADPSDSTLPFAWTRAVANGGVARRGIPIFGAASGEISTSGSAGSSAALFNTYLTDAPFSRAVLVFWAVANFSITTFAWEVTWWASDGVTNLGTNSGNKTVGVSATRLTVALTPPAGTFYYRTKFTNTSVSARDVYIDEVNMTAQTPGDGIEVGAVTVDKTLFSPTLASPLTIYDESGVACYVMFWSPGAGEFVIQPLATDPTYPTPGIQIKGGTATPAVIELSDTGATIDAAKVFIEGQTRAGDNSTPTANLHMKGGTATAHTAPQKIDSGTLLTTPEAGATEYDGSNLFDTPVVDRHRRVLGGTPLTGIVTVSNSASESSALFTETVSANELKAGRTLILKMWGVYQETIGGADTGQLHIKLAGSTIATVTFAAVSSAKPFYAEFVLTIFTTGVGGTACWYAAGRVNNAAVDTASASTVSIDTTVAQNLTATFQWSAAHTTSIFTLTQELLEVH